jgi:hypothetical protein
VQLDLKVQTFTLLGLLQTLAHSQLVQLTTMLTLLMQMETYTFGAEVLGLMQVRLLGRKDQLVLLALTQMLLVLREQLVLRELQDQLVQLVRQARLDQQVRLE